MAEAARLWRPDSDEPRHEETVEVSVSATARVTQRLVRYEQSNMLVEFAVVVSRHDGREWVEHLCIDTCNHGTVHRHKDGDHKSDPEIIRPVNSAMDVQIGLSDAIDEAYALFEDEEG